MADPTTAPPSRRWKVLAVTSLAVFAGALDLTIMYIAFPDIRRTFDTVTPAELSWVINAYAIVFAALLVPAGRLADRIGRKRVFFTGVIIFSLSSAMAGGAPTPGLLIAARAVQAVGAALLFPASLALVLGEFPPERRAMAVGIWGGVGGLAAATGPALGGLIVELASWRWAFYLNLFVGAASLFFGSRILAESRVETGKRPDLLGVPLLAAGVGTLALAIVQSEEWGWGSMRTLGALGGAFVLLPLFVLRSARHPVPTLDVSLFRSKTFSVANTATVIFGIGFSAMFFSRVLFLNSVWEYSVLQAGLLFTPGPLIAAILSGPAGRLADRYGHRPIMVPGAVMFTLGNAWFLVLADHSRDLWVAWFPSMIMTGIGVGMILALLSSAAVHGLAAEKFGVGSAVNQTSRQIGFVLGVALVIALLGTPGPDTILDAFRRVFALSVLAGVGTTVFVALLRTGPRAAPIQVETVEPALVPEPQEGTS